MSVDHDAHTLEGGETLRVIGDRVLVLMDAENDVTASGLVHIPGTAHETILGTGTILAYGMIKPKKSATPVPIPDLEVGKKCCFIKFLKNQSSNQQFRQMHQKDVVLLQSKDIMFLWDSDTNLRVS